jgi:poly(beta-D-mannuronate) lyase
MHAVVEHNLFERCNGEGELIGIKSHRNIIRGNTFKDCNGAVSIRDGNYNSVYGNAFIALDEPRAAGVRIHGKHNAFVNNYLYGIYKPIECCWGETDAPHRDNLTGQGKLTKLAFAYRASYDNLVAHNTFVACDTVFQWTKKNIPIEHIRSKMGLVDRHGPFLAKLWKEETSKYLEGDFVEPMYPPRRWFVLNNVILDTPQLVRINLARGTKPPVQEQEFRWHGNIAFRNDGKFDVGPERQFSDEQFRSADPGLSEDGPGVFRPGSKSICRGQAKIDLDTITPYVDRPEINALLKTLSDIGASGWKILAAPDVGPRTETNSDAKDDD